INPEDLEHVTETFFTRKEPGKGVGCGLPIAYAMIQEHKGTLEIESEVAKGTTVRVKLPINL
ncbi:MAG: ATP-binding protein, partial [Bacteroidales bacterium]|nr:ATP-binding protein [Bacteroidales bacterium]